MRGGRGCDEGRVFVCEQVLYIFQVCLKLGWTPPTQRTQFDVLPVVLQAAGAEPQWYEIPRELILEVPITHPE